MTDDDRAPRTVHLPTADDTAQLGAALAHAARPGDVIALIGDLGAGKTTLVRAFAATLGIDPAAVSSPTFVFVHEYEPDDPAAPVVVHIDAYRIESMDAFRATVWGEDDGEALREGAIVLVEWADRVIDALPVTTTVRLQHAETGRVATVTQHTAHL